MAKYNNSAGRILEVLADLGRPNDQRDNPTKVAESFGCPNQWGAILRGWSSLEAELNLLRDDVNEQYKGNAQKCDLANRTLKDVEMMLYSLNLNIPANAVQLSLNASTLISLEFIATDLIQEEAVTGDDLSQLRSLIEELRTRS